jgi:hypothetical protein
MAVRVTKRGLEESMSTMRRRPLSSRQPPAPARGVERLGDLGIEQQRRHCEIVDLFSHRARQACAMPERGFEPLTATRPGEPRGADAGAEASLGLLRYCLIISTGAEVCGGCCRPAA